MLLTRRRGVVNFWTPSTFTLVVFACRRSIACCSLRDRVSNFSLLYGRASNCRINYRGSCQREALLGLTVLTVRGNRSLLCPTQSGLDRSRASWGSRRSGWMAVTRYGRSEPISSNGCAFVNGCHGNFFRCLHFCCVLNKYECSGSARSSTMKALLIVKAPDGWLTSGMLIVTDDPRIVLRPCLSVQSGRLSGIPFDFSFCVAS